MFKNKIRIIENLKYIINKSIQPLMTFEFRDILAPVFILFAIIEIVQNLIIIEDIQEKANILMTEWPPMWLVEEYHFQESWSNQNRVNNVVFAKRDFTLEEY